MNIGDLVEDEWSQLAIVTSNVELKSQRGDRTFIPFGHNLTVKVTEKT